MIEQYNVTEENNETELKPSKVYRNNKKRNKEKTNTLKKQSQKKTSVYKEKNIPIFAS